MIFTFQFSSKFKILKCLDFRENAQFKPKNYNLPSSMTFRQAVLKQIS